MTTKADYVWSYDDHHTVFVATRYVYTAADAIAIMFPGSFPYKGDHWLSRSHVVYYKPDDIVRGHYERTNEKLRRTVTRLMTNFVRTKLQVENNWDVFDEIMIIHYNQTWTRVLTCARKALKEEEIYVDGYRHMPADVIKYNTEE